MKIGKLVFLISSLLFLSCKNERVSKTIFTTNQSIDTLPFASGPASNIILLEAIVQGEQYKLVFDSGSSTTLLDLSIPSTTISSDTIFFNDIVNRSHASFQVLIDTLRLGGLQVVNRNTYTQRSLNIDGILGDDIIGELVWKIDLFNRKMYVTRDLANFQIVDEGIPFTRNGPYITIKCEVAGVALELIVDTGYSGFISMNKAMADTILHYPKAPIFWEGVSTLGRGNPYASSSFSQHIDSTYYFAADVSIGGITLKNEIIELRHFPLSIV